ncbi:MAG TPA: hypothetical protein H9695_10595 [Candidatus Mediterraneibacter excrementigallinarum]|nr:hypothetical protein [Candidatus Mediterraneibacter excrementigallinarum]
MRKRTKKEGILFIIFSVVLATIIILGRMAVFNGDVGGGADQNYFREFEPWDALYFILIAVAVSFVLILLDRMRRKEIFRVVMQWNLSEVVGWKVYLAAFILILLAWLPYLLALSPGSVLEDSLDSVSQILDPSVPVNNHHPVFYTLYVGIFVKAGLFLGNINIGVFLYSVVQAGVMAGTIAYTIMIMCRKAVPVLFTGAAMIWYMFMPFFPDYAMTMWKDPIFSCALLWMSLLLMELAEEKEKICSRRWLTKYMAVCLITAFFRNNGIYVVVLSIAAAAILCRGKLKRFLCTMLAVLAAYYAITGTVYNWCGIRTEFVESVGIPLQQIAAVVVNDGDISQEEEQFLYTLLPEEEWKNSYAPCLVDKIKWNGQFNDEFLEENKTRFLKVWMSLLVKNFPEYVKAYGMETLGFWKIGVQDEYGYIDTFIAENGYGIHESSTLQKITGPGLNEFVRNFRIYVGSGTLLWLILGAALFVLRDKSSFGIVFIPALGNWMTTMIAAPVAFSLRYVYIFALGLPLFLSLPIWRKADQESFYHRIS